MVYLLIRIVYVYIYTEIYLGVLFGKHFPCFGSVSKLWFRKIILVGTLMYFSFLIQPLDQHILYSWYIASISYTTLINEKAKLKQLHKS